MLFSDKSRQLPYLADYLQAVASRKPTWSRTNGTVDGLLSSAVWGGLVGGVTFLLAGPAAVIAAIFAGASAFAINAVNSARIVKLTSQNRPLEDRVRLEIEAKEVVARMLASMSRKRLHRDLSPEVATVLEEGAEHWARARTALTSPYWSRGDLSPHMQAVRDQSLDAIERGMQELLVLFSTTVPNEPGNWNLGEVVDEVFGKDMFARNTHRRISPFHDNAVQVVRSLSELADEATRVSMQLVNDPTFGQQSKPGASLEATLAELRSIREAEEELREDLQH
jgi:hypothetical protein